MTKDKKSLSFLKRQRNTIVAILIVFAVLLGGYFAVKGALTDDTPAETTGPSFDLLPGEALRSGTTLVYPYVDRQNIAEVKIHNPANASRGEQYVDWGITFAYDEEQKDYYGYLTGYDYAAIDETQLTLLLASVTTPTFTSRVEAHCLDFSRYGLSFASEEEATYVEIVQRNGTVNKLYFGRKNPSGTGYYVRSGDTVTDDKGNTYVRDSVYLMGSAVSSYYESAALKLPTAMLDLLMGYPVESTFSSFLLLSSDERLKVAFLPLTRINSADKLFAGSSVYYSASPAGYFSSAAFEARIKRFQEFAGIEVMEYATKLVTEKDKDGKDVSYYMFENETLAKYGLDPDHIAYSLLYSSFNKAAEANVSSEIYFSKLQADGYYYAYSLNFNTVLKVEPTILDFLGWDQLDFFENYAMRMSIGYCDKLTVKGKIDGVPFEETFKATVDKDYIVKSVYAEKSGKDVNLTYYRTLFQEIYTTMLWQGVPEDLDKEALMATEPYMEVTIQTPTIYTNLVDNDGTVGGVVDKLESVTRVLRFYQYSNGRALMTVEMIDKDGNSNGESGEFYVRFPRLDRLLGDTQKLVNGIPFSQYEKE